MADGQCAQGHAERSSCRKDEFEQAFPHAFYDPAFEPLAERNRQDRRRRLGRLSATTARAPRTGKAGPGFADPDYDLSGRMARGAATPFRPRERRTRRREIAVAHSADQRLIAQRAHLPRRNVEDLPALRCWRRRSIAATRPASKSRSLDLSRLTSEYGRVIYPCKVLRLDRDAALPLAVLLLSEPRARPDQRLDERDLSEVGRGARRHDRRAR